MNHEALQDWAMRAAQWIHITIHERVRSFDESQQRQRDALTLLDDFDGLVAEGDSIDDLSLVERICLDDYPLPDHSND
jgi:hypothetical protein